MLNTGLRCGLSASTDTYVDQARRHPGSARTYVHLDELTWPNVAQAYKTGATFVTNGPLIDLAVEGSKPGAEVSTDRDSVSVSIVARSIWGINRAEIICNGEVVATLLPDSDGAVIEKLDMQIDASGWLAARAYGPPSPEVDSTILPKNWPDSDGQFAHTSPVYIRIGGVDMTPDPDAANYFARWIDAYKEAIDGCEDLFKSVSEPEIKPLYDRVIDRLNRAKDVFEAKCR